MVRPERFELQPLLVRSQTLYPSNTGAGDFPRNLIQINRVFVRLQSALGSGRGRYNGLGLRRNEGQLALDIEARLADQAGN